MTNYLALRRGLATFLLFGVSFGVSAEPLGAADCVGLEGNALQGDALQGGLLWGRVAPGSGVTWNDRSVTVLPDGSFVVGVGRDAPSLGLLSIDGEAPCQASIEIGQRNYRIQRVEGVPQQTVTPPEEVLERIARERELVRQAKSQRLQRPDLLADLSSKIDSSIEPKSSPNVPWLSRLVNTASVASRASRLSTPSAATTPTVTAGRTSTLPPSPLTAIWLNATCSSCS